MYKYIVFIGLLSLVACEDDCKGSANSEDSSKVDDQQKIYAKSQPIPTFTWSQDRDNLIQIYKMKNESRSTYAVVRSVNGDILWHCPSIGFPIPADTQLTNPLQWVGSSAVVEQPEPNGLYSSKNSDGTYVLCASPDGTISPQYTEAKVESFTRPVKVENVDGKMRVVFIDGQPSMVIVYPRKTPA